MRELTLLPVTADSDLVATVNWDTFIEEVGGDISMVLLYASAWTYDSEEVDPGDYGITVTGTPAAGDRIMVDYAEEQRGTITPAEPATLTATGWNLFDSDSGYARVAAYDGQYKVGGTYATILFAETPSGTTSAVTVDGNGLFTVPGDGYILLTGTGADTYVLCCWTDWTGGYPGSYEPYEESEINLANVMSILPYGLCAIGGVYDEINFNTKQIIRRIGRSLYTEEARAAAAASGRQYDFDEDYVYLAMTDTEIAQSTSSFSLDGQFDVNEHGLEFFTGTEVEVGTEISYGASLKDKLERDVLQISQQTLTTDQKNQVRQNLGLSVANNLTTTGGGYVLDARQGKTLKDRLDMIEATNWSAIIGQDGVSVPSGTDTALAEINLTPGSYILVFTVQWSSNTNGLRTFWISEVGPVGTMIGVGCISTIPPAPGNYTRHQVTMPYYTATNRKLYVAGNQNSGSTLTAKIRLGKARIA